MGAFAVLLAAAPDAATLDHGPPQASDEAFRAREVRRIRAHFDSALSELEARDVSHLTPAQFDRRAALLTTLRGYRDRGMFPRNHDFPGQAVPYFVDRETGVLCAVAHLLESSGRRDIVDRVARMNNNVWVPELAGDTAFTAWLEVSGLTLDEAARVQVPYESQATMVFAPYAAVAGGGSVVMSLWNVTANRKGNGRVGSMLGMTAGIAAIAVGGAAFAIDDGAPALGAVTMVTGIASTLFATRSIMRGKRLSPATRDAVATAPSGRKESVATTLTPTFSPQAGAGITVQVRF